MTDDRENGLRLVREMIPAAAADVENGLPDTAFGAALGELSLTNVFGRLWTREGLDRRSRSLVTLGILIALGATEELKIHFAIARQNGLSREELEEVIYHASGYAGFPAANKARMTGSEVLDS
ncbi:carboxymuconolactone decarboxylase family protein [Amycolatopsis ultiminotia]|uniref:Carboxymuconolactone decarboxylase family protein n=1 Tax=Amycolatopsis ultiminotia TaxID=543629 RepID=A0ABP6W9L6_9PSEU